jgi:peptidyl-prolyl cis-trans isomerase D
MLQKLRDQTQGFGFKVLVGVLIFVLAIFGFGAFNLFVTGEQEVASVNGEDISQEMLIKAAEREQRRLAAQFGEQFDPSQIDLTQLQLRALEQLISQTLLFQALDDLGMNVSQQRVDDAVRENPVFQIDGRYDADTYRRMVQNLRYSPREFLQETRSLLALDQLQSGLTETAFMTDWELAQSARLLNQRRDLAYLEFAAEDFKDQVDLSEEEVRLRYSENELQYQTDESADVLFVELSAVQLVDDPAVEVTEDQIQAAYASVTETALSGDQRESSHILLQVNDERSAENARQLLEGLKQQLAAGAAFADLAQEYSEDPGSAAQGGALGLMAKGVFAPEFEDALWALGEGEVSDPVQTEFGYHLIRLEKIIANEIPSLDEMRGDLESQLKMEQAELLFLERMRELDNLAFEQPDTLDGIVQEMGLQVQSVNGVTRAAAQGIFANAELREAVFTNDVLSNGYNSPAIELTDSRAVVLRVAQRHDPQLIPFVEVEEQIRDGLLAEQALRLAEQAHAEALARVQVGERVTNVARDYELQWQTFELARRNDSDAPPAVLRAAFALPRPRDGEKSVGEVDLGADSHAVVTVTRVQDGDIVIMAEREIEDMRGFLDNRAANLDFAAFYSSLEQDASIERQL